MNFNSQLKILLNIIIAIVPAAENFIWIPGVIFPLQFFWGVEYFYIMCLQYVFLLVRKYHAYLCVSMQGSYIFQGKKTHQNMFSDDIWIYQNSFGSSKQWIPMDLQIILQSFFKTWYTFHLLLFILLISVACLGEGT